MIRRTNNYQITWPKDTHFRTATCEEVDCAQYINGWITRVIIGSPQDRYIRKDQSRKQAAVKTSAGEIDYYYEPGQQCFRAHTTKIERAPFFTVNAPGRKVNQPGRESGRLRRRNMDFDRWADEFNEASYRATRR